MFYYTSVKSKRIQMPSVKTLEGLPWICNLCRLLNFCIPINNIVLQIKKGEKVAKRAFVILLVRAQEIPVIIVILLHYTVICLLKKIGISRGVVLNGVFVFWDLKKERADWLYSRVHISLDETKNQKKCHFPAPPILNIFSRKFHILVLGWVGLIDAKGIDMAQLIWPWGCPT